MFSINLVFVDAKTIRRLNKKYRKKDKVTTVLSFYYGGQANFSTECLGEIIICPTEAKKQNIKTEDLVVHGLKSLLPQIPTAKNI
ncbi:MAG TPA: rRNA maturation RNase YbeY [Nevskiaceae bacterium]|nr:rRNA maturation RNase YbeY [Nevskiaceae bacterium]